MISDCGFRCRRNHIWLEKVVLAPEIWIIQQQERILPEQHIVVLLVGVVPEVVLKSRSTCLYKQSYKNDFCT
jgi:hypothetical protein